jgi:Tol biopolymer transport system component
MNRMRWPLFALFACSAACAEILGIDDGIPRDGGATADTAPPFDAPPAETPSGPCNLALPFGAPVALGSLNTSAAEQQPRLSPDEKTIWFERTTASNGFDLFVATRASTTAQFDPPSPVGELDTASNDVDLTVSPDGMHAYWASDRAGGLGGLDVWQAERDAAAAPFDLVSPTPNVSSSQDEHATYYVPGALYFVSDRGTGGDDIYRASEQSGGFASPLIIPELASPAADSYVVVSTDELHVWFASTRGDAGFEMYEATRAIKTAPWSTPTVVAEFASSGNVLPGWISPDGCRLYLSSDKSGDFDVYVATKSK